MTLCWDSKTISLSHEVVEDYFTVARRDNFKHVKHDYAEEIDKAHGWLETWRYWICEDIGTLPYPERWEGLSSIGMVERECLSAGKSNLEQHYFINSIAADAKHVPMRYVLTGEVENRLHWRLDVFIREDESRIRMGNAPAS